MQKEARKKGKRGEEKLKVMGGNKDETQQGKKQGKKRQRKLMEEKKDDGKERKDQQVRERKGKDIGNKSFLSKNKNKILDSTGQKTEKGNE